MAEKPDNAEPRRRWYNNASLGTASLWIAILGIVVPLSLSIIASEFFVKTDQEKQRLAVVSCAVLVTLELIALGCGIAARATPAGRVGRFIATIVLVGCLLRLLYAHIL